MKQPTFPSRNPIVANRNSFIHRFTHPERAGVALAIAVSTLLTGASQAGSDLSEPESKSISKEIVEKTEKPPPLPWNEIEGSGGVLTTLSAYVVNPPRWGEPVGRPSLGTGYINLGNGRELVPATLIWSPTDRIELGYGYNWLNLGDLPDDIQHATGVDIDRSSVSVHNFNARFLLLKENQFDQKWLPALNLGVHAKVNDGISDIDSDLGGALESIGLGNSDGVDFTLYATKLLTFFPRPVLINIGGRATTAAELGFLGFSSDYRFLVEASAGVFLTDWLILAGEYRQQPNTYDPIPSLVGESDDWWTVDLAWIVNKHLTVAAGYGHFGNVANHEANGVWGVTAKYEF